MAVDWQVWYPVSPGMPYPVGCDGLPWEAEQSLQQGLQQVLQELAAVGCSS